MPPCINPPPLPLQLIQTNKLKHYPSIHGDFSAEFRQPCVLFTGHPSLRFGDAVHFVELWGKSSLNTIIFTGEKPPCGSRADLLITGGGPAKVYGSVRRRGGSRRRPENRHLTRTRLPPPSVIRRR